jgi:TolB protein
VVYVRHDSLYVQSIENGEPRYIAGYHDIFALAWSPDGRLIAFAAGNSKFASPFPCCFGNTGPSAILVVPADSGPLVAVTDRGSLNVSPAWTPDSRRLLFVSNRDGPRDIYTVPLDASARPSGPAVRLSVGLSAHSIALSPDGRRLAYSVLQQRANIWSLPITSGPPLSQSDAVPVTTGSQVIEWAAISSDGKRLYFDSNREGNSDIYRQPLPDGAPVQLTRDPSDEYSPSESPNGRWIVFHAIYNGKRGIMVMPAEGGPPQRVTTDSMEALLAHWSPDGRSIAYSIQDASDRNGLYVVSRDSAGGWGRPRQVSGIANEPIWFPDGKTILVAWDPGVLWAVPAEGGPQRLHYAPRPGTDEPNVEIALWMPDGRSLVMKSHDGNDIASFWLLPASGERPRLLARLADPLRPSPRDELATDGKRLYFIIHEQQSDIYVAELSGVRYRNTVP